MLSRSETNALSALCAAAVLALNASAAAAQPALTGPSGALNIAPLRVELPPESDYAAMQLGNAMERPVSVQVRVFSWHQKDGSDHYAPSNDLIVSPSLFRIHPGAKQDFRVIRQAALPAGAEHRYRVVIDQLPEPVSQSTTGTATRLQLLVPLFAGSQSVAPAQLHAAVSDGTVTLTNAGGRAARIDNLALIAADGTQWPVGAERVRYVHGQSVVTYSAAGYSCANGPAQRLTGQVDGAGFDVVPTSSCP